MLQNTEFRKVIIENGIQTGAWTINRQTFDEYIILLVRALYFSDRKEKMNVNEEEDVEWHVHPLTLRHSNLTVPTHFQELEPLREGFKELGSRDGLIQGKIKGENIDVFWYQSIISEKIITYRLMFYNSFEVLVGRIVNS